VRLAPGQQLIGRASARPTFSSPFIPVVFTPDYHRPKPGTGNDGSLPPLFFITGVSIRLSAGECKSMRFDCGSVENIHFYRYIGISHAYVWRIKANLW
jgi:hypothetical protein